MSLASFLSDKAPHLWIHFLIFISTPFLVACTWLYKPLCPFVGLSFCLSVAGGSEHATYGDWPCSIFSTSFFPLYSFFLSTLPSSLPPSLSPFSHKSVLLTSFFQFTYFSFHFAVFAYPEFAFAQPLNSSLLPACIFFPSIFLSALLKFQLEHWNGMARQNRRVEGSEGLPEGPKGLSRGSQGQGKDRQMYGLMDIRYFSPLWPKCYQVL